jgi:adenosylcobinamide-GDP ribazoletransferase
VVLIAAAQLWAGWLPALIAVAAGILITGAFHEDGLADTADGLGGGRDMAQRLAIMKDSRIGTYGALALMVCLAAKVMAIGTFQPHAAALLLVAAHGGGRAIAVVVMSAFPYAGDPDSAKSKPVPDGVTPMECLLALLLGLWPLLFLPSHQALIGLIGGCVLAAVIAFAAKRLIQGYTGDVLGAVEQLFELGFLLAVAARS